MKILTDLDLGGNDIKNGGSIEGSLKNKLNFNTTAGTVSYDGSATQTIDLTSLGSSSAPEVDLTPYVQSNLVEQKGKKVTNIVMMTQEDLDRTQIPEGTVVMIVSSYSN